MRERVEKGEFLKSLFAVEFLAFCAGALVNTFLDALYLHLELNPRERMFFSAFGFFVSLLGVLAFRSVLAVQYIELSRNLEPLIEAKVSERCQHESTRARKPLSGQQELNIETQF